ncbi:unnamed protein product [Knipowitschia caucasica]|uniref:Chemokine interleukin-8-like domain-containing protein n=1 Tax=Knipowitschia caucasica TaxID=637954 RepID=A0AAV2L494_KNICA
MKKVWLMTGLMITALCCSATPWAPNAAAPSQCCFSFSSKEIPPSRIISVVPTGKRCSKKGFIVTTPQGKVCVALNQGWMKRKIVDLLDS